MFCGSVFVSEFSWSMGNGRWRKLEELEFNGKREIEAPNTNW